VVELAERQENSPTNARLMSLRRLLRQLEQPRGGRVSDANMKMSDVVVLTCRYALRLDRGRMSGRLEFIPVISSSWRFTNGPSFYVTGIQCDNVKTYGSARVTDL